MQIYVRVIEYEKAESMKLHAFCFLFCQRNPASFCIPDFSILHDKDCFHIFYGLNHCFGFFIPHKQTGGAPSVSIQRFF